MQFLLWPWHRTVSICLCCHPFFAFTEGLSPKLLLRAETMLMCCSCKWGDGVRTCHLFEWVFVCNGGFSYVFSCDPGHLRLRNTKTSCLKRIKTKNILWLLRWTLVWQVQEVFRQLISAPIQSWTFTNVVQVLRCSVMWDFFFFLSDHSSILPCGKLTPLHFCFSRSRSASPHRSPTPADDWMKKTISPPYRCP